MRIHRTILGLAIFAALAAAGPAGAHGGSGSAFTGIAGPYKVVAYDGRAAISANEVEYRILLSNSKTQAPVDGATVNILATLAIGDRHAEPLKAAAATANIYSFTLPRIAAATWRIDADIRGPIGVGATQYFVHAGAGAITTTPTSGSSGNGNTSKWLSVAVVGALAVAAIVVALLRRRSVGAQPNR